MQHYFSFLLLPRWNHAERCKTHALLTKFGNFCLLELNHGFDCLQSWFCFRSSCPSHWSTKW